MDQTIGALLLSWFVGVLSGLLVSIPVGPVNIAIVNEGAHRGFKWALHIGLGSVVMEVIYCTIGFAGFSGMFQSRFLRATLELVSFLLMLFLGLKYLFLHSLSATNKTAEQVEHRLHPHTAFMIGFVRVLGNPGVLLGWITISAAFVAHEWVSPNWISKLACIAGVGMGALAWFVLLSRLVSHSGSRFSSQTLVRMSQVSGASLLVMAIVIGSRIIDLLAHR
ncbi:MAG: LysE family translocator [Candidatus Omnitrophica bacterium]|nr:LysE family translocator [Candidatus Omnitrophota bacterium]